MRVGKFNMPERDFRLKGFDSKFYIDKPIFVVAEVSRYDGTRYLVMKHKKTKGSANFKWFAPRAFHSYVNSMTLEDFKIKDEQSNLYYWVEAPFVRLHRVSMYSLPLATRADYVLTKLKEDDV